MRVMFMGSAALACPSLERLLATPGIELVGAVTQPDRPKGRSQQVSACPVADVARRRGLPVLTPEKVNTPESLAALAALTPDMIVVVAYGQILRPGILSLPHLGCVNLHGSLLPKYRGAAPIQWAVANGEAVSGVTVMFMNERMDAGDMVAKREVPIAADDTGGTYGGKLAHAGAELLVESVQAIRDGRATRTPQDESLATLAPKLSKQDGRIDWRMPPGSVHNRVRGFNPWPGGWTVSGDGSAAEVLKVLRTRIEAGRGEPGKVLDAGGEGPLVACGDGGLRLLEVQPEGRKPMGGGDYVRGHRLQAGHLFT